MQYCTGLYIVLYKKNHTVLYSVIYYATPYRTARSCIGAPSPNPSPKFRGWGEGVRGCPKNFRGGVAVDYPTAKFPLKFKRC